MLVEDFLRVCGSNKKVIVKVNNKSGVGYCVYQGYLLMGIFV